MDVTGKTVNVYDDTVHFEDGSRAFGDGTKVQWPNWQPEEPLTPESFAQEVPAELGGAAPAAPSGKINKWDGTIHNSDGSRSFPNGDGPVVGVNKWAQRPERFV